jgi:4-hydroxyphenylpyruvate dioxygenase
MERLVLAGGKTIHFILSKPVQEFSVAAQYLKNHPEGIGFLNYRVSDLDRTVSELRYRHATFLYEPQSVKSKDGTMHQVAIATALDDVNMRFVDDKDYKGFGPSFEMTQMPGSYQSPLGFECIDHLTCNVRTLQPLISFYRDVLGFEAFWEIKFHTNDVNPNLPVGSGLKSTVMWHPESGIKFANNEPDAPFFRNSQIDIYCRDNKGSGVQHVAFMVPDIQKTVANMRQGGASFLPAGPTYYEKLSKRLSQAGFKGEIKEDMGDLKKLDILVDASPKGYLLQIFTHEMGRQYKDPRGGAMFFEVIQREGDNGFGGGNFRALFETIEHDQIAMAKVASQLPLELL